MRRSHHRHPSSSLSVLGAFMLTVAACAGHTAELAIEILDSQNRPVPQVAVYAAPLDAPPPPSGARPTAVMDQQNRAFVPHILIASTGTEIRFPNSDAVSHHVYSFSPAKSFELSLYKRGALHPPLTFETPGVVTLGCNIHDDMVGYILVVDTSFFALTDEAGRATLEALPIGRYAVHAWTPRLRPADLPLPIEVAVDDRPTHHTMRFDAKLRPAHDDAETPLQWSRY